MRRLFRWAVRIGLGIVAFFVSIFAALLVWNPSGALLFAALVLGMLISNHHPPPIAEGVIMPEDWGHQDVVGGKLMDALRKDFPVGTPEALLRSVLLKQGFKPPKPPPAECMARERPRDDQLILCPVRYPDPDKILEYGWAQGLVCGGHINVEWTTDGSSKITGIKSSYYDACL